LNNFRTISRSRWLLRELVVRDLMLRYRGSILGFAWTLLNPILFMVVYTLVFSVYLKSALHAYPLFLLSGLIPWIWFSGSVSQAATSIIDGSAYVGKTLMPTELLVLVPVLANGANFVITIVLLIPVSLALGVNVVWAIVFLPVLALIELAITFGLALLLATYNVFFRDLQQLVGYIIMALFFLTPIFYARSAVPPNFQFLVTYSPLAALISAYQAVFYYGVPPDWRDLLFASVFGAVVLGLGLAAFNSRRDAFPEYV
jgi:ABC-type polysaccharide/polyol phosphate export permease